MSVAGWIIFGAVLFWLANGIRKAIQSLDHHDELYRESRRHFRTSADE